MANQLQTNLLITDHSSTIEKPTCDNTPKNDNDFQNTKPLSSERKTPVKWSNTKRSTHFDVPLVINISYTQYEIIHEVAVKCNLRTSCDEEEDWDIWFIDAPVLPSLLTKMKPYQRTNHFPGMYALARKNCLAKNL